MEGRSVPYVTAGWSTQEGVPSASPRQVEGHVGTVRGARIGRENGTESRDKSFTEAGFWMRTLWNRILTGS